jgi:hypothetical protein
VSSSAASDTTAFEVREALGDSGCVICRLSVRSVGRYIQALAYEQVNDLGVRRELRQSRGLCNQHAYRWLREAHSVLGTALIYRDVIQAALADLDRPRTNDGLLSTLRGGPQRRRVGACIACRAQRQAEARYLHALLEVVAAEEATSPEGVCRRHALAAVRLGGTGAERIVEGTRRNVQRLLHDLDEVVRKEDYRFRSEPRTEAERTAPARAISWSAGVEGLVDNEK